MKSFRCIFWLTFFCVLPSWVYAYTDRIDARAQEIYDAAFQCYQKEGISQAQPEKKSFTTKWIYNRIRRARKRRFVPIQLKENVDLRYQMQIKTEEGKNYSEVSVQGRFEEKATDAAPQQVWKRSFSSRELYFKEREAFFKILNCLEAQKKSTPVTTPSQSA